MGGGRKVLGVRAAALQAMSCAAPVLLARRQLARRADALVWAPLHAAASAAAVRAPDGGDARLLACIALGALLLAHVALLLAQRWSVRVHAAVAYRRVPKLSDATAVLVDVSAPAAESEGMGGGGESALVGARAAIVPLRRRARAQADEVGGGRLSEDKVARVLAAHDGDDAGAGARVWFEHRRRVFECVDERAGAFAPRAYPERRTAREYVSARGLGDVEATRAAARYGANSLTFPDPSVREYLAEQMTAPFFVFQLLCVALWMLDEVRRAPTHAQKRPSARALTHTCVHSHQHTYMRVTDPLTYMFPQYWYYSLFTLAMLLLFETTVANNRARQVRDLRRLPPAHAGVLARRGGAWVRLDAAQILPGDVVSIGGSGMLSGGGGGGGRRTGSRGGKGGGNSTGDASGGAIPADVVLLSGRVVVNEAMLTGESTPQWKTPAEALEPQQRVGALCRGGGSDGSGRSSVLFAGTSLVQCAQAPSATTATAAAGGSSGEERGAVGSAHEAPQPMRPPDGGVPCYVLRTGFDTAQGELMRTILFSTERVSANSRETGLFILFLLGFAVAASAYVLREGLADPQRSRYKLLLQCVMIVTSVVPPELPMELSMAVNNSLVGLARQGVFCTEPFRIPLGGKVGVCCFDKTGTLTSDSLTWRGVAGVALVQRAAGGGAQGMGGADGKDDDCAAEVCSSAERSCAGSAPTPAGVRPRAVALAHDEDVPREAEFVLAACHSLVHIGGAGTAAVGDPIERAALAGVGWGYSASGAGVASRHTRLAAGGTRSACRLALLTRHHFSSELQRMSVVARLEGGDVQDKAVSRGEGGALVLTKGSPEAVARLLSRVPSGYRRAYSSLASQGARVLALAYRCLEDEDSSSASVRLAPRASHERDLLFAGFAVFGCPMKAASAPTLAEISAGGHRLVMITGDAPQAAVHAASRCHIFPARGAKGGARTRGELVLRARPVGGKVSEENATTDTSAACGSGDASADTELDWYELDADGNERVHCAWDASGVASLARSKALCAEGAAVGALLLAPDGGKGLRALVSHARVFARATPQHKEAVLSALRACGATTLMVGDGTNDVGALQRAHVGVALLNTGGAGADTDVLESESESDDDVGGFEAAATGVHSRFGTSGLPSAAGDFSVLTGATGDPGAQQPAERAHAALLARAQRRHRRRMLRAAASFGASGGPPTVQLGDASMAAAFTARSTHVGPVAAVLRLGRATLVTTVQMFKILGVNCLTSAYAMSVMAIDGVKIGDTQATLSGILAAALFLFLSMARPLRTLSRRRPHASPFSAYALVSVGAQAAVHLAFMVTAVARAKAHVLAETGATLAVDYEADFEPNVVNTVAFTSSALINLCTFGVNYVGLPFNEPLSSNKPLYYTLVGGFVLFSLAAADVVRPLSEAMELAPLPGAFGFEMVRGARRVRPGLRFLPVPARACIVLYAVRSARTTLACASAPCAPR